MAKNSAEDGKGTAKAEEAPESPFRYSLELVATIAASFADGNTSDNAAADRAIKLLDAVSATIARKLIIQRAREKAERVANETPKHLDFAKGLRWLFGRGSETKNIEPFRKYLRLNIRLVAIGHPSIPTEAEITALLAPLPEGPEKEKEDASVQTIEKRERDEGFHQVQLVQIKEMVERYKASIVSPYMNSEKGKKGGRGKKRGVVEKSSKKSLARKSGGKS